MNSTDLVQRERRRNSPWLFRISNLRSPLILRYLIKHLLPSEPLRPQERRTLVTLSRTGNLTVRQIRQAQRSNLGQMVHRGPTIDKMVASHD